MGTVQSTAIAEYSKTEAALAELANRYKGATFAVDTKDGLKSATKARAELRGYRTSLEALRKDLKEPALRRCQLIDSEARRITRELEALEDPIDAQIKAHERREEEKRQAAIRAERERVDRITARIALFARIPVDLIGAPAADIAARLERLHSEIPETWAQEFLAEATVARNDTITRLETMRSAALEAEEQARRIAEERARQQAEARRLAEERAKAEAEEAERRRRIAAEEEAARQRIRAEEEQARQARAAEEARIRAEREALEAAQRKQREEEEAKAAAERRAQEERERQARLEQEQRERAERERQDAERRAREEAERKEREAQEAAEREERRKQQELADGHLHLQAWLKLYGHRQEFADITAEIREFLADAEVPA